MTRPDIETIKARAEGATPGRWYTGGWAVWDDASNDWLELHDTDADAQFIAHSREDIPEMLAYIAELEQERRWIQVSERLPEVTEYDTSREVLVAVKYKNDKKEEKPTICIGYLADGEWWTYMAHDCHSVDNGDKVTHWMPLPKQPEGVE